MSTIDEPAPCHEEIGVQRPDPVANNGSPTVHVNKPAILAIDPSTSWDEEIGIQPPGQAVNHSAWTSNVNTLATSSFGSTSSGQNENKLQSADGMVKYSSSGDLNTSATSSHDHNGVQSSDTVVNNNTASTEQNSRYFDICVPLWRAAIKGHWREAEKIILQDSSSSTLWSEPITEDGETLLHIAAGSGQTDFVRKLLEIPEINYESLKKLDKKHRTPFVRAVAAGAKTIVELMLKYNQRGGNRNTELLNIRGHNDETATLYYAALYGRGELMEFLYDMPEARGSLSPLDREHVFFACMDTGLYGVAQKLLDDDSRLATARHSRGIGYTALHILARNPSAFYSRTTKFNICLSSKSKQVVNALSLAECLWNVMKMDNNKRDLIRRPTYLLFDAVKLGNLQLLQMLINSDPNLLWEKNEKNQTIFHVAVKYRRADIFYLIYETGPIKDVISSFEDNDKNNMLHLAAMLPPQSRLDVIPGAALQMQQELLWYKDVKKIMDHELRDKCNADEEHKGTPEKLFLAEHKDLLKAGEEWMNNRAQSCSIVATLIATVVFAIAFTIPGGNDQASGLAMFLKKKGQTLPFPKENQLLFDIFAISTAIALGASTMSIIIFLSILISPYSYQDFLKSLPQKLMVGLLTLLISMIGMMFAFCMAFMLAYAENTKSIPWIIIGIEVLPIVSFVVLQGRLFYKVFRSTNMKLLFPPRAVNL